MAYPPLTLRDYRPADAEAIAAIYAHYVATSVATFDFIAPPAEKMAAKLAAMRQRGHPVVIGETEGVLAGYAYASEYRERPGYRFTCEDSIYLSPAMCGRGYGTLMLGEVIEQARAAGFAQMLAVIAGDAAPSVALHRRFGFELLGTFPRLGHKFDRWIDVMHMQKAL